jgi:hypothetical protein
VSKEQQAHELERGRQVLEGGEACTGGGSGCFCTFAIAALSSALEVLDNVQELMLRSDWSRRSAYIRAPSTSEHIDLDSSPTNNHSYNQLRSFFAFAFTVPAGLAALTHPLFNATKFYHFPFNTAE